MATGNFIEQCNNPHNTDYYYVITLAIWRDM